MGSMAMVMEVMGAATVYAAYTERNNWENN